MCRITFLVRLKLFESALFESITVTREMNIDSNEMDQNDEMDQNSLDQVKTNQMFVFDRTNKRKDFQSGFKYLSFPVSFTVCY